MYFYLPFKMMSRCLSGRLFYSVLSWLASPTVGYELRQNKINKLINQTNCCEVQECDGSGTVPLCSLGSFLKPLQILASMCTCGCQRTAVNDREQSQFSPHTSWFPGIELKLSGLAASPLPAELSLRSLFGILILDVFHMSVAGDHVT